jgi:ethanolamine ammonia-lyase large subunit
LEWCVTQGIFARTSAGSIERGPHWGNVRRFCESDAEFRELVSATPTTYGFECAGARPANNVSRTVRLNQAIAREATRAELRLNELQKIASFRIIETEASSKEAHLNSPELGSRPSADSLHKLAPERNQVQVVVSDGLSAEAVHYNTKELLPVLMEGLTARQLRLGQPILARYGRVKLAEPIAECLQVDLVVYLIGERPGGDALASRSLSAYLVYRLGDAAVRDQAARFSGNPSIRFEYSVISNIYSGGLPPVEAAAVIVDKACAILNYQAAGNRLEAMLK